MIKLRTQLSTDFHRQLASPEWVSEARSSLETHPAFAGRDFEGVLRARYTAPESLGPQSAVKYRFEVELQAVVPRDCPMSQTFSVVLDYLHVSKVFKFRTECRTTHAWRKGRPRQAEPLLRYGLAMRGLVPDQSAVQKGDRQLAFERDILRLGGEGPYQRFGVRDVEVMAQTIFDSQPVRFILLEEGEFRAARAHLFGEVRQEEHHVHVFHYPVRRTRPAGCDPDFECSGPGYFLMCWGREDKYFFIRVQPGFMVIRSADGEHYVQLSSATWCELESRYRLAVSSEAPRSHVSGDKWRLSDAEGIKIRVQAPMWGTFLKFGLSHLELAGFGFVVRRVSPAGDGILHRATTKPESRGRWWGWCGR